MLNSINISLSGLRAAQDVLGVTAHNVANVQTPGFRALRADLAEVSTGGVRVSGIRETTAPGMPLPDGLSGAPLVGSNVNLASEIAVQLVSLRAFQANAALVRSQDGLLAELLDIRA
jgi:flagellar hook protein FlgE